MTTPVSGEAVRAAHALLARREPSLRSATTTVSSPSPMTKTRVLEWMSSFAEVRRRDGDSITEHDALPGRFLYETGDVRTAVIVWGEEDDWTFSAVSAARVGMRATPELYRRVSVWRSTVPICGCYVIEDEKAAVLCERTITGSQVFDDDCATRLFRSTTDLVGDSAQLLHRSLAADNGIPFTAGGVVGLALLLGWWEIQDPEILRFVQDAG